MATAGPNRWLLASALLCAALLLRWAVLDFVTGDAQFWVVPWYEHLLREGYSALGRHLPNASGYEELRGNYSPPYYYLLYLATFFEGWAPRLHLVKAVSIAFDFVAAGFMYRLAARHVGSRVAWFGFLAVLLAPTVIANGAMWGQCDVVISSLLLGAVYFSTLDRPWLTIACFGAALSFKATAVFLAPYLLLLALRSRLGWKHLAGVPLVYAAMMLPAAVLGRPLSELLLVYRDQAGFFDRLSMNAPNLYHFIPNAYYHEVGLAGILLTIVVSVAFALSPRLTGVALTPPFLLLAATTSATLAPFLLPKMHDRYFFSADLLSIALALVDRRRWFVPVFFQVASMLAYVPIIMDSLGGFDAEYTGLQPLAIAINTALFAYLAWSYGSAVRGSALRS